MGAIVVMLIVIVCLLICACMLFIWATRNDQFTNLEHEASRIFVEDDDALFNAEPGGKNDV